MANIFQDKIVKYLTIGLFLASIGLLVQSLLSKPAVLPPAPSLVGQITQLPTAALSAKNLDNWKVEKLKPFAPVEQPARVGRENPFEPYPLNEEIISTSATTTTTTSSPSIITTSTPVTSTP